MWQTSDVPAGTKPTPSALSKAVAGVLRAQRGRIQASTTELGHATGISQSQVSAFLNAKKRLDIEELDRICYALGLKLTDVIRQAESETADRTLAPDWSARPLPGHDL